MRSVAAPSRATGSRSAPDPPDDRLTLGAAAETQGLSTDASVTALMAGFSLGTTGTAALVMSATGPEGSWLLRTPVIVRLLLSSQAQVPGGAG